MLSAVILLHPQVAFAAVNLTYSWIGGLMSPTTATSRKRRKTPKGAKGSRTPTKVRVRRVQAGDGPNLARLSRAGLLAAGSEARLGSAGLERIEKLPSAHVQTLLKVARKVGRKPRCWLI